MPGSFGTSDKDNGAFASTKATDKVGVFGSNEATAPPSGGGAGGAGVFGLSVSPGAAGVFGANTSAKGVGVQGNGPDFGVSGFSQQGTGLRGITQSSANFGIYGSNDSPNAPTGGGAGGAGVFGLSASPGGAGVFGANNGSKGVGVQGNGPEAGVSGFSKDGIGVRGNSTDGFAAVHGNGGKNGVWGYTVSPNDAGVFGSNDGSGNGVTGFSKNGGIGVRGDSPNGYAAVHGNGGKNGVWGYTVSANDSGVFGSNDGSGYGVAGFSKTGIGVLGRGGRLAGRFEGDVEVTGDIRLVNADCAEDFDIADTGVVEPGTVMVLGDEGKLQPSGSAYDKRVTGVISGAGNFKPGIVLDKQQKRIGRQPIALLGKVYCKVDASFGPVEIGDLLTTCPTPGHAMKASDPSRAFGAVIGKALSGLQSGTGLIPVLVALQ